VNPDAALKALAEAHRRDILRLVSTTPRSVGEIAGHLDISSQAVSRHLKVLREADLVDERREGTRHLFLVRPDGFAAVQGFLDDFWTRHLGQLKATLERPRPRQPPTAGPVSDPPVPQRRDDG
jgi:DNA-binding transcriptional ArsR family regulator